ncbi:MAG TPA: RDD family protein [Vicinamibacterales bacterium]|nr:RDD family protein [Vicinamibacterales bacterium]
MITRAALFGLLCALMMAAGAADTARAQEREEGPRALRPGLTITIGPGFPQEIYPGPFIHIGRSPIVRVWQDYQLANGHEVGGLLVVGGNATIDGRVHGDVVVVLGAARLGATAVIDGALIVIAGDTTIATGAAVHQDLVVVGGELNAPPGFAPRGDYFVIGVPWLGDSVRSIVPWVTRGLLLGRPLVPDLGWMWWIVGLFLIVALAINVFLHGPVGVCADMLAARPLSAFLAGLLVLLLTGPVALLLTATVIGVLIVPFLICAVLLAWIVGRVGVARWIGRRVTRQDANETPLEGVRSFLIGFVALVLLYMVPVIGLITWAMVGVFGLGAASLAVLAGLRRERPPAPAPTGTEPPRPEPPPPPPLDPVTPPIAAAFSMPPDVAVSPPVAGADPSTLVGASPSTPLGASAHAPPGSDLRRLPRATFLDRAAAFVLDVILVVIGVRLIGFAREEGAFFLFLFAYFVAFWAWKGTTVGGIICNLRLVRVDGVPLRFVDALVRGLSSIFSFAALGLGCLWILRDPESQAWHDKIAGTYVVKVPRNCPLP